MYNTEFNEVEAVIVDVTYPEESGISTRLLELFTVTGKGESYRLQVSMPSQGPQRNTGEKYFDIAQRTLHFEEPDS
jgi:hypothetical protein